MATGLYDKNLRQDLMAVEFRGRMLRQHMLARQLTMDNGQGQWATRSILPSVPIPCL